ncbi:MAG TPA: cbb3-type cytochrome oxidase assembly protein CcoS, partial [Hyphomonas sp.]|nr:cbb3-type cytochrome oxidase assembly protein CcoS [Hyphomonas sp.]
RSTPSGSPESTREREMTGLLFLIPIALFMGLLGLGAFLWAVKSGQFDDPVGAANRILIDDDKPL